MKTNIPMLLDIRVVPKAGRNLVKRESPTSFKVYLTKPATKGEANEELIKVLAEYFKVKRYMVTIIKGDKVRGKLVRIAS
ncbi:MAG: DUF167 domain-containing protein [Candidatus Omnitrophica bacterium]|nr:DUF167 domain-containing protein [Candidatus Omnitrophota bacterium]